MPDIESATKRAINTETETYRQMTAKKAFLTLKVFYMADNPHYIIVPRKMLVTNLCVITAIFSVLFLLLINGGFIIYLAIPALVFTGYVFFLFTRIWRAYKYSLFYPAAALVLSVILGFFFRYLSYAF